MRRNASNDGVVKFEFLVADDHDRGVPLGEVEHGGAVAVDRAVVAQEALDVEDPEAVARSSGRGSGRR